MFKLNSINFTKVDKSNCPKVFPRIRKNAKIFITSMEVLYSAWKKGLISWDEYNSYTDVYGFKTYITDGTTRLGVVKTSSLVK